MKKRRSRRLRRRIRVEFSTAQDTKVRVGFTTNLSQAGMFVGTSRPYPVGTPLEVKLLLDQPIVVEAIVVHSLKGIGAAAGLTQSGMGLRLVRRSPRLNTFVGRTDAGRTSDASPAPRAAGDDAEASPARPPRSVVSKAVIDEPPPREPLQPAPGRTASGLEHRFEQDEAEPRQLQETADTETREKGMLRRTVSNLEMRLAAEAGRTQEAEERQAASARRITELEGELARARAAPPVELPNPTRIAPRKTLAPWLMLVAGAVLGALGAWLVIDRSHPGAPERATEPATRPEAHTATEPAPPEFAPAPVEAVSEPFAPETTAEESIEEVGGESPPESESVDPTVAAEEMVRAWASAWSEKRVEDYLGFYSADFEPPDALTRGAWNDQRRDRLGRPPWIRVEVEAIEATTSAEDRVTLSFDQSYETPTYRDRVRKTFDLVRELGGWKIVAVRTEPPG